MSKLESMLKAMGLDPEKFFRRGDRGQTTMDATKGLPMHPIKGRDQNSGGFKVGKPVDPNASKRNDETP